MSPPTPTKALSGCYPVSPQTITQAEARFGAPNAITLESTQIVNTATHPGVDSPGLLSPR